MHVAGIRLQEAKETPETRYLLALLSARGLLLPLLAEMAGADAGAAGALAQIAQKVIPAFERTLAKGTAPESDASSPPEEFLLGLMEAASACLALLPRLVPLLDHPEPRVRAGLAMLAGKIAHGAGWLDLLLSDEDPRVRANAIESLWGATGALPASVFRGGLSDRHQRVVANAAIGLYQMGDAAGVTALYEMAHHADARFRAAAAWAMGRTGDPRFLGLLRAMRRSGQGGASIVKNTLQSIARIQEAGALRSYRLRPAILAAHREAESVVLELAVTSETHSAIPQLGATAWWIELQGGTVWDYRAEPVAAGRNTETCILAPASAGGGAEPPRWLRRWARELGQSGAAGGGVVRAALYTPAPALAARAVAGDVLGIARGTNQEGLDPAPPPIEVGGGADELEALTPYPRGPLPPLLAAAGSYSAADADRHLVVVAGDLDLSFWRADYFEQAAAAVTRARARLHGVLTPGAPPTLREALAPLCRETGGTMVTVESLDAVPGALAGLVASFRRRYRITLPHAPLLELLPVRIEVNSGLHHGELSAGLPLGRPARAVA